MHWWTETHKGAIRSPMYFWECIFCTLMYISVYDCVKAALVLPSSDSSVVGRHLFRTHLLKWPQMCERTCPDPQEPRAAQHSNKCILICDLISEVSHHQQHPATPRDPAACHYKPLVQTSDFSRLRLLGSSIALPQTHTKHKWWRHHLDVFLTRISCKTRLGSY